MSSNTSFSERFEEVALVECAKRHAKARLLDVYLPMCHARNRQLSSLPPLTEDDLAHLREGIDDAIVRVVIQGADEDDTTLCGDAWVEAVQSCLEGLEVEWVHTPGA